MIYTVTFNPSLDYIVDVKDFKLGMTNRTASEQMFPGGKGINVSIVLSSLGIASTALGFIAGFTGKEIAQRVRDRKVSSDFIQVEQGFSRINVKLRSIDGTEINGAGPVISPDKVQELMNRLDRLTGEDTLVLAGSIPSSMPASIYMDILRQLEGRGIQYVVDATGDLLLNVLPYHPFLIKPNHHELGELFGVTITSREQVPPYARKLQEKGARNVLVSMGGQGAVLLAENGQVLERPAPKGNLVNAVGAGDSMVAGFLTGWMEKKDYEHAFKMGLSAGSASAFSEKLAERAQVEEIYRQLG